MRLCVNGFWLVFLPSVILEILYRWASERLTVMLKTADDKVLGWVICPLNRLVMISCLRLCCRNWMAPIMFETTIRRVLTERMCLTGRNMWCRCRSLIITFPICGGCVPVWPRMMMLWIPLIRLLSVLSIGRLWTCEMKTDAGEVSMSEGHCSRRFWG